MNASEIAARLKEVGYSEVKVIGPESWIAVRSFLNGYTIVRGTLKGIDAETWFYRRFEHARDALRAWNGIDQPTAFLSKFTLKNKHQAWDQAVRP